jgi:hypothetical protein
MRLAYLTATAVILCMPVSAYEPTGVYQTGTFNVSFRGETMKLISDTSDTSETSDLYFSDDQDTSGKIVRTYVVEASPTLDIDAPPRFPITSVEFELNPETKKLVPVRVLFAERDWDTAWVAFWDIPRSKIKVTNLIFRKNGGISFDIKAEMVQMNLNTYKPVKGTPHQTLTGHYSGTFPDYALQYQREFGDY